MESIQPIPSVIQATSLSPHVPHSMRLEIHVGGVKLEDIEYLVVAGRTVADRMYDRKREFAFSQVVTVSLYHSRLHNQSVVKHSYLPSFVLESTHRL